VPACRTAPAKHYIEKDTIKRQPPPTPPKEGGNGEEKEKKKVIKKEQLPFSLSFGEGWGEALN
jgi:hypothetical protein